VKKTILAGALLTLAVVAGGCAQDNSRRVLFQDGTSTGFTLNSLEKRLEERGGTLTIQNHQGKTVLSTPALKIELQGKPDAYYVLNAYLPGQRPSGLVNPPGGIMLKQAEVETQGNVKRIFAGLSLGD
jgi:hypothetical protein